MSSGVVTAAYIVAAILFIFSLAGLSKHETSKQGITLVLQDGYRVICDYLWALFLIM